MKFSYKELLPIASLIIGLTGSINCIAESEKLTLIDGAKGIENFNVLGNANWMAKDGAIQATEGSGGPSFLVTKESYSDFYLRVEFWASEDANSGIFMRCQNPEKITDRNCYEANIYDQRADQSFSTGGVVHIGMVSEPYPRAGGKWNTYEMTLQDSDLLVVFNGETTVDVPDSQFTSGPIAMQWYGGTIRFRKFEIHPL